MDRRTLLIGAGTIAASSLAGFSPERAHAAAQMKAASAAGLGVDWSLGTTDLVAEFADRPMRRISGRAPAGLSGALYRNGPGQWRRPGGDAGHWFDGDGLMRAFRINEGRATLSARFIDTPKRRADAAAGAVVTPGFGTLARPGARVSAPTTPTRPTSTSSPAATSCGRCGRRARPWRSTRARWRPRASRP
jgi:carotenoid cleavage dioxygenase-like enzyme